MVAISNRGLPGWNGTSNRELKRPRGNGNNDARVESIEDWETVEEDNDENMEGEAESDEGCGSEEGEEEQEQEESVGEAEIGEEEEEGRDGEEEEEGYSDGEEEVDDDDDDADDDDDDDEEEEEEEEEEGNCGEENGEGRESNGRENEGNGFIYLTLASPALDCLACNQPLRIPVLQCENGHLFCSPCSKKLGNKCSTCPWPWPLSNNRCKAIENLLESAKVSCQNTSYGCNEVVSYSQKHEHELNCIHSLCSCPFPDCTFIASSKNLCQHISRKHHSAVTHFWHNVNFLISIQTSNSFRVLKDINRGNLFMVNTFAQPLGTAVTVACLATSCPDQKFVYDLSATARKNCIRITSAMERIRSQIDNPPSTGFLMVPSCFFDFGLNSKELQLSLSIGPVPACH